MTNTTTNMSLVLPDVSSTVGPTWATLLNAAYTLIDSHDHSTGKGVKVTPSGLNISSDLTFAQNNATNLRSARLYNNSSISLGVNDKTCLYSLNNELYYVDGAGNNIQVTTGGALNIAGTSSLTLNDSAFILQYFGDTSRKARFDVSNVPVSTTRIYKLPTVSANDTLASLTATQTLTATTLTNGVISGCTAVTLISGSGTLSLPTSGTVTVPNGTDTLVNLTGTQTLTGKILTGNTIASFTPNGGTNTLTVPAITDTLVTKTSTDVLTNKTLGSTNTLTGVKLASLTPDGSNTLTMPVATDTLVGKATTDILSNKSFSNAATLRSGSVLQFNNSGNTFYTSLGAGANISSYAVVLPIADGTAGQVVSTDGAGNWGFSTVATTVGTVAANDSNVVFTNASNRHQSCLPTAARTYTMATTSIVLGDTWTFDNQSLFLITVNSSGGNLIGYVWPKSSTNFVALANAPTTAANWNTIYESIIPAVVQANDGATTFVFTDNQFQISNPTAARTYILPTTGVPAGYIFEIYNQATAAANYITVQSSGTNQVTVIPPLGHVKIMAAVSTPTTAANWILLHRESQWVTYTPAFVGFGTVSAAVGYSRVQQDSLHVQCSCTSGTVSASTFSVSLPAGMVINASKLSIATTTGGIEPMVGMGAQNGNAQSGFILAATTTSTSVVYIGAPLNTAGGCLGAQAGNTYFTSSGAAVFKFEVPVL